MKILACMAGLIAGSAALVALAQNDPVTRAIDQTVQSGRAGAASQQRINSLDDQTRGMLERYRNALWQTQQLRAYASEIEPLLAQQDAEKQALRQQLADLDRAGGDLMPLMLRMLDSLEKFRALDLPFLVDERRERVENLRRMMTDPATPTAEKFRRILEAYQIEADYGRNFGAERGTVDERLVEVLRIGRTALFAVALDNEQAWRWDAQGKRWEPLPGRYVREVRKGLKIAREMAAPDYVVLPMSTGTGAAK